LRFYGAHPDGDWLKDVEGRVFRAHVAALPRLRAEEELASIQRGHAFTDRPLEGRARSGYIGELERHARGERHARKRMDKSSLGVLASMGIKVRRVGAEEG
jgi:hypothetical protein